MAQVKPKKRKGVPPILTMEQAVSIAEQIYKKAGSQSIFHEDLAVVFGNVTKSSGFILKLMALRTYGLISRVDNQTSSLTELAIRLFSATSEQEEANARLEIFRNPQPLAALYNAYAGQVLPEKKYLINVLEKLGEVSADFYDEWAKRFELDGRYAGVIYNDPRERPAVRRTPGPVQAGEATKRQEGEPPKPPTLPPGLPIDFPGGPLPKEEEYKIPTPSGLIRLYVPKDCAAEDLGIAKGLLELIINRLAKEKVSN